MSGGVSLNAAASFAELLVVGGGAWRLSVGLARWKASVDAAMTRQDEALARTDERLDKIEHELTPNSGHSHHDQVMRRLGALEEQGRQRVRRHWW